LVLTLLRSFAITSYRTRSVAAHDSRVQLCRRLGWILAETVKHTGKCSTLRGPPRSAGFLRIPVLILAWFWGAACGLNSDPACDTACGRLSSVHSAALLRVTYRDSRATVRAGRAHTGLLVVGRPRARSRGGQVGIVSVRCCHHGRVISFPPSQFRR
jgi:hypothetical protein